MQPFDYSKYHVGIICPLKIELVAMRAMLDEEHGRPDDQHPRDHNVYFTGRIHKHNVVIACLPAGVDGSVAAASTANNMVRTFPQLRFALLVGIGGGIPDFDHGIDIRLGDVVVSQPHGTQGGVVQYDKGKKKSGLTWERKGSLNAPPTFLLTALQSLQSEHELNDSQIPTYLSQMAQNRSKTASLGYTYPGAEKDIFNIQENLLSVNSRKRKRAVRDERVHTDPVIHYGTIASGNTVVKNAAFRNFIRTECNALCVEMEAAGLMNDFPCLVIKGISDYADESKNDEWQRYAAATSAAFAKELLLYVSSRHVIAEETLQNVLSAIKSQSKDTLDLIRDQEEKKLYRECHQSLHTCTYEEYKELNRQAVRGTCQWLLQHPKFSDWYRGSDTPLLWLSADPGCGKSVLSRYLIDEVLRGKADRAASRHAPHTICYFFFKDNSNQDSLSVALSAVLHQFFTQQPELIRYAIAAYKTSGNRLCGEVGQLWAILLNAARDYNAKPITCVFDGLDECRISDRKRLIDLLCRFYDTRVKSPSTSAEGLKFFVTSRPYNDIQDAFGHIPLYLPSIRLRGEDENDQIHEEINLVIEENMADLSRDLRLSPMNAHRIKDKLLKMQNRTYLWLYLVVDHIRISFGRSLKPDREPVNLLPRSVDEAYEQLLMRVEEDGDAAQVKLILSIILGSRRALSVAEMALALDMATESSAISSLHDFSIEPERLHENIRQWCGLFIFINHGYIYLLHQTAKEFLLSQDNDPVSTSWRWKQCLPRLEVEKLMAIICVDYQNIREFDHKLLNCWMKFRRLSENSRTGIEFGNRHERVEALKVLQTTELFMESVVEFFEYAANHWASHFQLTERLVSAATLQRASRLYDCASLRFSRSNHFFHLHELEGDSCESHATLLAAYNGHCLLLDQLLDKTPHHLATRDLISNKTLLVVAAEQGHCHVVETLLNRGVPTDFEIARGKTAMSQASFEGHVEIVRMLLDARPPPKCELVGSFVQALRREYMSIITLLLDAGLDIHSTIDTWDLPLNPNERGRDSFLMWRLREAGVSLGGHGDWGTPLHLAVWKSEEALVKDLIERGADINAQCSKTGSVLRTACLVNDKNIIQFLWSKQAGVDPHTGSFFDTDAFLTALTYSHHSIINKFIEAKVDVNKAGSSGYTALQAASARGDEVLVRLLLDCDANVNTNSLMFGTALFAAAEKGHEKVVRILLANKANMLTICGKRGTALHAAAANCHHLIVQILLDAGMYVDSPGDQGETALFTASCHGHNKIVRLLLSQGAVDNCAGREEDTALYTAASEGYDDVVGTLLDAGTAEADLISAAFDVALCNEHHLVVEVILSSSVSVNDLLDDCDYDMLLNYYDTILKTARRVGRDDVEEWMNESSKVDKEHFDHEHFKSDDTSDGHSDPFRCGEHEDFGGLSDFEDFMYHEFNE